MAHTSALQAWAQPNSLSHRVSSAVKSAWLAYWTRKAERATVLALHALDDRTLKDIGMDRSEIESVVYNRDCERRIGLNGSPLDQAHRSAMCV